MLKEIAKKYMVQARKLNSHYEKSEAYKFLGNCVVNEAEDCYFNSKEMKDAILKRRSWEIQFEVKIKQAIKYLEESIFSLEQWKKELPPE
jgi:hypothetical protein